MASKVEPLACTMCYCALFNLVSHFYGLLLSFPLLVFSFFDCFCVIVVVILFLCVFIWMGKKPYSSYSCKRVILKSCF
jgi:hypothetical protein